MTTSYGGHAMGAGATPSRFDQMTPFASTYDTPGWQRAQKAWNKASAGKGPVTIEGELTARETGANSGFATGERIFHQKFGYGTITSADGNKLTIDFEKAGQKRVIDSFVTRP